MAKKAKKKNSLLKSSKPKKKKSIKREVSAKINENGKLKNDIPVVGIGASAGGLEAFSQLLSALPADTGMAFVFVQHLAPSHESMLKDLLAKSTKMKVVEVKDNMEIVPNQVFVIPPGKYLTIKEKRLLLSEREKTDGAYMPVNHFFRSLVKEQGSKSIGVILSGTASDGTLGLRAIKAEGGLTFAQDEASAKFYGMPYNAVASGNVDFVLPPYKIAKELARIGLHPYVLYSFPKEEEASDEPDDHLSQIFKRLRIATGVDFSYYKINTVKRRITRRMILCRIENIEEYVKYLKANKKEIQDLYQDLLINVTHFFRDADAFESLKKNVYPELVKNMNNGNPLRIWVPGCSTGEEVYSIAISLFEFLGDNSSEADIKIFGTDINEHSIEKARAGIYPDSIAMDVPEDLINSYFTKIGRGCQIIKQIRDICVFARQDLSKDPPFSRIDLVSCRNLLIYLSQALQKKIIPVFHYALKPNGYLMLGTSESIGTYADLFSLVENKNKLYVKKSASPRMEFNFNYSGHEKERAARPENLKDIFSNDMDIQKEADKVVLNKYSPAGVLIKGNLDIIQFRGDIGEFIKPMPGEASLNLFRMAREG
ncbi:MAG TPA: chemotaxis protein CheB, partial [Ignavibacteriaceae bacterium]|nr:chemotaxis protein CheB [Ignavibacteriaceae bacterium]